MSSLDAQLLAGERIVHRCRPHWILFAPPFAVALAGVTLAGLLQVLAHDYWYVGADVVGLAAIVAVGPALRYLSSEFAVTDKRVVARMGLLHRHSPVARRSSPWEPSWTKVDYHSPCTRPGASCRLGK